MFTFAFRNLFRQKSRTAMTLAAIILGVVSLILSGGFVADVYVQLRDATIHSRTGFLQVYRQGYYEHGRRDPYHYMIENSEQLADELFYVDGVLEVLKRINFSGLLNNGRTDQGIIGEGVEPDREARLGASLAIIDGRQLTNDDFDGVLIGEGLARSLAIGPGDFVTLVAYTTDGAMNTVDLEVVGVFRSFSKDYDARAIRIPLDAAAELIDTSSVHALVFSLVDARMTDGVASEIQSILSSSDFEVMTWLDLDDFYQKTKLLYQRYFGVLQVIILGIVLLSVANSVNMTVSERAGEFGTLRALGRRTRSVFMLIVLENTILAIIGASAGVVFGITIAAIVSAIGIPMPPPPNANSGYTARILVESSTVITAFTVGCVATIASAMLIAMGATRVSIVDGLRQNI